MNRNDKDLEVIDNAWTDLAREMALAARRATAQAHSATSRLSKGDNSLQRTSGNLTVPVAVRHEQSGLAHHYTSIGAFALAARHHHLAAQAHLQAAHDDPDNAIFHLDAASLHDAAAKANEAAWHQTGSLTPATNTMEITANSVTRTALIQSDFIHLSPQAKKDGGTSCANCQFSSAGICTYNGKADLRGLQVSSGTCCNFWASKGMSREWNKDLEDAATTANSDLTINPFVSEAQRRYMWANHPDIARRWEAEGKGYVKGEKKSNAGEAAANEANFVSEAQRRFMWSQYPDIAEDWARGRHSAPSDHKMPPGPGPTVKGPQAKAARQRRRTHNAEGGPEQEVVDEVSKKLDEGSKKLAEGFKEATEQAKTAAEQTGTPKAYNPVERTMESALFGQPQIPHPGGTAAPVAATPSTKPIRSSTTMPRQPASNTGGTEKKLRQARSGKIDAKTPTGSFTAPAAGSAQAIEDVDDYQEHISAGTPKKTNSGTNSGGAGTMDHDTTNNEYEGFDKLKNDIEKKSGYSEEEAAATAAAIGRKKYGAKDMARKAAAGRKAANNQQTDNTIVPSENELQAFHVYNNKWSTEARQTLARIQPEAFAGPDLTFPIVDQNDLELAANLVYYANDPKEVVANMMAIAERNHLELPKELVDNEVTENYDPNPSQDEIRAMYWRDSQMPQGASKATKDAARASNFAKKDKTAMMHKRAARLHREAAREALESGKDRLAELHAGAAKWHSKEARGISKEAKQLNPPRAVPYHNSRNGETMNPEQLRILAANCQDPDTKEQLLAVANQLTANAPAKQGARKSPEKMDDDELRDSLLEHHHEATKRFAMAPEGPEDAAEEGGGYSDGDEVAGNDKEMHSFDNGPVSAGSQQAGGKGVKDEYPPNKDDDPGHNRRYAAYPASNVRRSYSTPKLSANVERELAAAGVNQHTAKLCANAIQFTANVEHEQKLQLVRRIVANVLNPQQRHVLGNKLMGKSLLELQEEYLPVVGSKANNHEVSVPLYIGANTPVANHNSVGPISVKPDEGQLTVNWNEEWKQNASPLLMQKLNNRAG